MKKWSIKAWAILISFAVILCDNSIYTFAAEIVTEENDNFAIEENAEESDETEELIVPENLSADESEKSEEEMPETDNPTEQYPQTVTDSEESLYEELTTEENSVETDIEISMEYVDLEKEIIENENNCVKDSETEDEKTEVFTDEESSEDATMSEEDINIEDERESNCISSEEYPSEEFCEEAEEEIPISGSEEILGAESDLAFGICNDINWRITAKGHLVAWGKGDYYDDSNAALPPIPPWGDYQSSIRSAEIKIKKIRYVANMFCGCINLVKVDLRNLDTSIVCDCGGMFGDCSSLQEVNLSCFKNSDPGCMYHMFENCVSLKSVSFPVVGDTSDISYYNDMFSGCSSLTYVNLGSFIIHRDADVDRMFDGCINLHKFVTPKRCDAVILYPVIMWNSHKKVQWICPGTKTTLTQCYNVGYDYNDGERGYVPTYHAYNKPYTLIKPKRKGYSFAGWYDEDTGEKVTKLSGRNLFVYALWTPNKYTVTLNGCGGTCSTTSGQTYSKHTMNLVYDSSTKLPNVFSRAGYYLDGWSTKPKGKGKYYYKDDSLINLTSKNKGNVNLYAIWKPSTYVVSFNINTKGNMSGSGSMTAIGVDYGKKVKLPANGFSCKGYTFKGWSLTPDGPVKFKNKASVKNLITWGEVKLYAVWSVNTYSVKFSANGAIKGTPPQTVKNLKYGVNRITLPQNPFTPKANYRFAGWNLKSGGNSETRYLPGRTVDLVATKNNQTITLYAEWDYDLNVCTDGTNVKTISGISYNQSITTKTLESRFPELAKNGYYIAGWNTSQSAANKGKIKYKSSVKNVAGKVIYPVYKKSK